MSTLKDVSIIVKWNGKEFPINDLSDQETVAVLKHEIAKLTNVRPERQKLLNLKHRGKRYLHTFSTPTIKTVPDNKNHVEFFF